VATVLARFQVADYDAFRPGYDRALAAFGEIRSYRVWRGQDDPNLVVITETFDSREVAEALWTSPATREAMVNDGIDMTSLQIDYLDEIDSGTH
jgi:quinol monooxygenase YgiN